MLAHIRCLSLGSYGCPRMTIELKEVGLNVGERRVARLMRINSIKPVRTRRHKVTTDSHHRLGVAANWLARENEQLRRENRVLKEERDILKKATQFFASQRP